MINDLTPSQIEKLYAFIKAHPTIVKIKFVTSARSGIGITVFAIGEFESGNTADLDITDYSTW